MAGEVGADVTSFHLDHGGVGVPEVQAGVGADAGEEGGEQRGVAQLLLTDLGQDAAADEDAERREDVSPVEVAEEGPEAVDHVEEGAVRR